MNLSNFVEVPPKNQDNIVPEVSMDDTVPDIPDENKIIIKKGILFAEVWDIARHTRTTHPNEPVEWFADGKVGDENTYTLFRVVTNGT